MRHARSHSVGWRVLGIRPGFPRAIFAAPLRRCIVADVEVHGVVQDQGLEPRELIAATGRAEEHALTPTVDSLDDGADVVLVTERQEEIRLVQNEELETGAKGVRGEQAVADALRDARGGGDENLRRRARELAEDAGGAPGGRELAGALLFGG